MMRGLVARGFDGAWLGAFDGARLGYFLVASSLFDEF